MTSKFKVQGSLKALMLAATAVVLSLPAMQASAAGGRVAATTGGRGVPTVIRPVRPSGPPRPVIVVPPCKRGGPGITPC